MIQYITWNEDGSLVVVSDNGKITFSNEDVHMVDQYGNAFTVNDLTTTFQKKQSNLC